MKYLTIPENWKTVSKDGNPEPGLYLALYAKADRCFEKPYLVVALLGYDTPDNPFGEESDGTIWYDVDAHYEERDYKRDVVAYLPECVGLVGLKALRESLMEAEIKVKV